MGGREGMTYVLPRITVVTTVFNGAKHIEKTITSVLEQGYPNLEYMIVDGGSTDGTVDIIRKYADKLAYWVSEKDDGMYSAIQKGFDRATGEIMAWINADDYYGEHCFETVAEIFGKFPQIEWLTGLNVHYDEKGRIVNAWGPRPFTRLDFLSGDFMFVQQESTFWKRSLWEKAGSKFGKYRLADDFELWLRFSRHATLYCTSAYLGGFRIRSENQLSLEGRDEYLRECKDAIANEIPAEEERKQLRKIRFWKAIKQVLRKARIFNADLPDRLVNGINDKVYGYRIVDYDRRKQEFVLR